MVHGRAKTYARMNAKRSNETRREVIWRKNTAQFATINRITHVVTVGTPSRGEQTLNYLACPRGLIPWGRALDAFYSPESRQFRCRSTSRAVYRTPYVPGAPSPSSAIPTPARLR